MKSTVLVIFFLGSSSLLLAQLKHTQHQTFQMDSVYQVQIVLVDPFNVENWPGNQLMTETQVQLYQASESVLKFFLDNERYTIEWDSNRTSRLILKSKDTERRPIKTKYALAEERVAVRIFLPNGFEKQGEQVWTRPLNE